MTNSICTVTQDNVLDIIYTSEQGQYQMTIPLSELSSIFYSKAEMERQLLLMWLVRWSTRSLSCTVDFVPFTIPEIPRLFKISTCVVAENVGEAVVRLYQDWDGKFYYPQN